MLHHGSITLRSDIAASDRGPGPAGHDALIPGCCWLAVGLGPPGVGGPACSSLASGHLPMLPGGPFLGVADWVDFHRVVANTGFGKRSIRGL